MSVLDHGGLIVAARDYHNGADESRTLMYTCNEGSSWSQLTFTNENVRVFAVITEPGETSTVVRLAPPTNNPMLLEEYHGIWNILYVIHCLGVAIILMLFLHFMLKNPEEKDMFSIFFC